MFDFSQIIGFEWDKGNLGKNQDKHKVSKDECEEIFANEPLMIFPDDKHSGKEVRQGALGKTNKGRKLAIAFTVRKGYIRIISARDQSRKDRNIYEQLKIKGGEKQHETKN